jgi:hypothetical protein
LREIFIARRSDRAKMSGHHQNSCGALRPAPPPPPCFRLRALRFGGLKPAVARRASEGGSQGGPPPPLSRGRMKSLRRGAATGTGPPCCIPPCSTS